jgi:hypothetical protein
MSLVPGCSILRFAQNNTKRVLLVMLSGAKHLWLLFLMSLEKLSEILRFAQNDTPSDDVWLDFWNERSAARTALMNCSRAR